MSFNLYLLPASLQFTNIDDLKEKIDNLIVARSLANDNSDFLYAEIETVYDFQTLLGPIYSLCYQDGFGLDIEYKTKLQIIVNQNNLIAEVITNLHELNQRFNGDYNAFQGFLNVGGIAAEYFISNKSEWYDFHRSYFVINPPVKNLFCSSLSKFFPNIYFNSISIPQSLNSFVGPDYKDVMRTIIYHLKALNDDFFYIFNNNDNGGDGACDELQNLYANRDLRIEASRDKNSSKELNIDFKDEQTGETRKLYCDLHTKFVQYFEINATSPEQRSKRIYFEHPIDGFLNKKILIGWIGRHRN